MKNKLPPGLTVLGIVIGVAAVILLVSICMSAGQLMQDQFLGLGTNVSSSRPAARTTTACGRPPAEFRRFPPPTPTPSPPSAPPCSRPRRSYARGQVVAGNLNWSPDQIVGVNPSYLTIRNWQIDRGDFFTESDIHGAAKVCVVGATVADNLFQTRHCVGRTLRIKNIPFEVVGVLEAKGANLFGMDQDNVVLAPYTTIAKRVSGSTFNNVDLVFLSARSILRMGDAQAEVAELLRQRHRIRIGAVDDFDIHNTAEIVDTLKVITTVMSLLVGSIGGVSLIVGGVGIMNIMLVSVTERTREIGIRMAVGARARDILRQFLLEAAVLSLHGRGLGIALGTGPAWARRTWSTPGSPGTHWPLTISFQAIAVALVFSASVGVFFGYYPAGRPANWTRSNRSGTSSRSFRHVQQPAAGVAEGRMRETDVGLHVHGNLLAATAARAVRDLGQGVFAFLPHQPQIAIPDLLGQFALALRQFALPAARFRPGSSGLVLDGLAAYGHLLLRRLQHALGLADL